MNAHESTNRPRIAALAACLALLGAAGTTRAQGPGLGGLGDLVAIRSAGSELIARSRRLREVAGASYQDRALAAVRRSCAARQVTRLDDVEPALVESQASRTRAEPLLELDFTAPPSGGADDDAAPSPAEGTRSDADVEVTSRGLRLRDGQVRTTAPFAIERNRIGTIEIEAATTEPGHLLLGWSDSADAPRLRRNKARIELLADGRMHTYAIDAAYALARGLNADDSVRRFFLANRTRAALDIRALRVLPRGHRYAEASFGTSHEERDGQLRSVLYARPPTRLAFDVDVPADRPVLEAGLAALAGNGVIEFEVAVEEEGTRTPLLQRLVREAPWEDVALELDAWAGRKVRLHLDVRGSADAVALWSSPLLRPRLGEDRTEPVVVLLEDALRPDRMSVYGGAVPTPAHQRLARTGLVFERAFAQATQTRSSVPSMMTSLLPSATGTWDFSDALSDRYVTLAEALRACGFATASFLQNGNAGRYAGLAQGFDVVFGEEVSGPRASDLLGPGSALEKWTAAQRGRPWLAYVHVLDPHGPYDPVERPSLEVPSEGDVLARDRSIDAEWLEQPTADARRALYDAETLANDHALGSFLDRMQARGDLERAVFAMVADHGEFLGEHGGLWRHHPPGHVEVARVPFLLRTPEARPARIHEPVALLDLMPTLLDLAGIDRSGLILHGRSLADAVKGESLPTRVVVSDEMVPENGERRSRGCGSFATSTRLWLLSCTRDGDFVPGRLLAAGDRDPAPLRLFDLTPARLGRETGQPGFGRTILETLSRQLLTSVQAANIEAWKAMTDAAEARIVSEPETSERLRALGYLE